jgi:hypothetical protein
MEIDGYAALLALNFPAFCKERIAANQFSVLFLFAIRVQKAIDNKQPTIKDSA